MIADIERSRSTPLKPLVWMTSVLAWATAIATSLRVTPWVGVLLGSLTSLSFVTFLLGYAYLFAHDRDALRAERTRSQSALT